MLIPFDILYEGFCNRIRSDGKTDHILKIIKNVPTDKGRIQALLQDQPDLLALLRKNVSDCFENKDESTSRQLWKRGVEGRSLALLTEAISYCPIPAGAFFEEKVVPAFDKVHAKEILQSFLQCKLEESTNDPELMASLFYDRGCILCSLSRFGSALKDFLRAWLLGFPKCLQLAHQVAICIYECGELDAGKELLQCSAQHLRTLPMSNEEKSEWTMNLVKALKTVEAKRKENSKQKKSTSLHIEENPTESHKEEIETFSQVFMGQSEAIEVSSKAVELKYAPDRGRYMAAVENIPAGSTIISELPYAWTLSKPNYHKHCLWCLLKVDAGIPCSTCASAIFCNATCREQAVSNFHGKECRVMKLIDSSQKLGEMALICFRTILLTPLSTLEAFVADEDSSKDVISQLGMAGSSEKLDSTSYASVYAQIPNSEYRQPADLFKRTVCAIFLGLCLQHNGYLTEGSSEGVESEDSIVNIAALLLRHLQSVSCNAYGINYIESKKTPDPDGDPEKHLRINEVGGATYPVISTTNHSCNPNAYRINVFGKRCVVKCLRPIKAGEEIFDCYGPLYLTDPRTERINKLQAQYLFRCNCSACTNNWPSFDNIRKLPVSYKCGSCECSLVKIKDKNEKIKCPYCDHVMNMKKLMNAIEVHKERFSLAKTSILAEVFEPFDGDMQAILCDYIEACQAAYMEPYMDSIEAQEILKLFWNLCIRNL